METSMRRKATLGLLAVTLAWGATFIWMKQAMNAIETTQSNSEFDLGDVVIDPVFHDVLDQIRGTISLFLY